jgi:hypothetical protein
VAVHRRSCLDSPQMMGAEIIIIVDSNLAKPHGKRETRAGGLCLAFSTPENCTKKNKEQYYFQPIQRMSLHSSTHISNTKDASTHSHTAIVA